MSTFDGLESYPPRGLNPCRLASEDAYAGKRLTYFEFRNANFIQEIVFVSPVNFVNIATFVRVAWLQRFAVVQGQAPYGASPLRARKCLDTSTFSAGKSENDDERSLLLIFRKICRI